MLDRFAGVYFVPLVGVDDPRSLPAAIADALSLPATASGMSRHDHLLSFLREQRLLLVLDSFENIGEGAGFLAEILAVAPGVKLLVTSRQLLNLHEEWRYPLAGLPYPAPNEPTVNLVYPAIELFRQRAMQIEPDFSLAEQSSAVIALCRRLEGMPLGIELAAALVRVLSPAEIDEELTGNIDVLSISTRNMPASHRSLRAVFERSWQLLSDEMQVALSALSLFRGSFDREAAFSVAGLTLPMLADLVDQSLVRRLPSNRYDLHELMRQFVAEKLNAAPGEQDAVAQRHCHHFCGRLARMSWCFEPEKEADGFHYATFTQRISADLDNHRAAWRWAIAHLDTEAIRQAMDVFSEYLPLDEGWHLFDEAATAVQSTKMLGADEVEALTASFLLRRSYFWRWDLLPEAAETLSQSLTTLRRVDPDNHRDIAANLIWLGITIASLGRNDEGALLIDEGISLFHSHDHRAGRAWGLNYRGMLEAGRGRLVAARGFLEQSMALLGLCKNWRWRAIARANLADIALLQGDFQQARNLYEQSLAEEGDIRPELMKCLGESYTALGELDRAEACFAQAEMLFARAGVPYGMSLAYVVTPGVVALLRGDVAEAERLLVGSLSTARQVGFEQRIATNLHNLARLRHHQQRYDEAMPLLDEALAISRQIDFRFATALILCQLGHTATALHRPEAPTYYTDALQIALDDQTDRVSTDVIRGIAQRLATDGRLEEAVSLLALVVDHPASDYETRQKAQALLSELAAELPSDRFTLAMHQGRREDLHDLAARLLHGA
jgi:predicted ATPase/predicted negative regulator of RcsB-dependent stress response